MCEWTTGASDRWPSACNFCSLISAPACSSRARLNVFPQDDLLPGMRKFPYFQMLKAHPESTGSCLTADDDRSATRRHRAGRAPLCSRRLNAPQQRLRSRDAPRSASAPARRSPARGSFNASRGSSFMCAHGAAPSATEPPLPSPSPAEAAGGATGTSTGPHRSSAQSPRRSFVDAVTEKRRSAFNPHFHQIALEGRRRSESQGVVRLSGVLTVFPKETNPLWIQRASESAASR
jgi:hypothetical protein